VAIRACEPPKKVWGREDFQGKHVGWGELMELVDSRGTTSARERGRRKGGEGTTFERDYLKTGGWGGLTGGGVYD